MSSSGVLNPWQFCIGSAYQSIASKPVSYFHRELGYFSIDQDRSFSLNKSKLGTLNLPPDCMHLDINLNVGFEEWKDLPNVQQHLDSLLHWILLNKEKMTFKDLGLNVDFVTSRGNLARMLNVLSGKDKKGWTLLATRYRGTIYLSHVEADNDQDLSPFGWRVCYWGKRFELEVTKMDWSGTSECDQDKKKHGPIKAYPGFFSVVRFQLENHTIVLRAEVDAQTPSTGDQGSEYVELKVTTETIIHAEWAFKQRRLVPWWCQSIVSGTPLIVYGVRDYDGHVRNIDGIRTEEIPKYVGQENLDKDKYLFVLSEMLSWIKNDVCVVDHQVYTIQWNPNAKELGITANLSHGNDSNKFLRDWYVTDMEDYYASSRAQVQRNSTDYEPRGYINPVDRSSPSPSAGFREDSFSKSDRKGRAKETRKEDRKIERVREGLKESWPRRNEKVAQTFEDPRSHYENRANEAIDWTTDEPYMGDRKMMNSGERGDRYRLSEPQGLHERFLESTVSETVDSKRRSKGKGWVEFNTISDQEARKEARSRRRPRSPEDERCDSYVQIRRSSYPLNYKRRRSDEECIPRRRREVQDQLHRKIARERSGRKPSDSPRSGSSDSRFVSPSRNVPLSSDTRVKRAERDNVMPNYR